MKSIKIGLLALIAAAGFYAVPTEVAQAESRFHLNWLLPGFPPPPRGRHHYYPEPYEDDFYWDEEYDEDVYYYPYYEDDYYQPPPRYKKQRKKSKAASAAVPDDSVSSPPRKKKAAAKPTAPAKPKAAAAPAEAKSASAPAKPKVTSVSCDKAKSILSGYGFGEVEAKSCNGEVYSFAAKRDGKTFAVKVSALNGELTEVKRQ
jgi:hypothetical protein